MNERLVFLMRALDDAMDSDCVCPVCLGSLLEDALHRVEEKIEGQPHAEQQSLAVAH